MGVVISITEETLKSLLRRIKNMIVLLSCTSRSVFLNGKCLYLSPVVVGFRQCTNLWDSVDIW